MEGVYPANRDYRDHCADRRQQSGPTALTARVAVIRTAPTTNRTGSSRRLGRSDTVFSCQPERTQRAAEQRGPSRQVPEWPVPTRVEGDHSGKISSASGVETCWRRTRLSEEASNDIGFQTAANRRRVGPQAAFILRRQGPNHQRAGAGVSQLLGKPSGKPMNKNRCNPEGIRTALWPA